MSDERAADFLDSAADELEKGWTQGTYLDHQGGETQFCSVGALRHIRTETLRKLREDADLYDRVKATAPYGVAMKALADKVRPLGLDNSVCDDSEDVVIGWNDSPDTKKQEVLDTFRATAKELRA